MFLLLHFKLKPHVLVSLLTVVKPGDVISCQVLAGFESDGNAWERRSRSFFYTTGTSSVLFFLYTPIVNCNFVESHIH